MMHLRPTCLAAVAAVALAVHSAAAQNPLTSPPDIYSQNGVLNVTMQAAPGTYTIYGQQYTNNLYAINQYPALYAPPTLRLNPGDSVSLRLLNGMQPNSPWTNLHYHGFNVTPVQPGDDVVTLRVDYGTGYQYGFRLPPWHPTGMFWYHPHPHGISEPQVLGGMSGAIIVNGLLDKYPQWQGIPELVMLLKDFPDPRSDTFPKLKTINGQESSFIAVQQNAPQLWRFGNVGADAYFNIKIRGLPAGAMPFQIIARDGNPTAEPIPADSLFIPPSSRVEAIVTLPAGSYTLYTDFIETGPMGDPNPAVNLANVVSSWSEAGPAPAPAPAAPRVAAAPDTVLERIRRLAANLDGIPVDTIVFSEDTANNTFSINNKMYDPDYVDTWVEVPSVKLWLIQNATDELHVFHIHQTDFAVLSVNGQHQPLDGMVDTANLPFQADGKPGEVLVMIDFRHDIIEGLFVYHCHILEHEDGGMMANIVAYPAGTPRPARVRTGHAHP